MTDTGSLMPFLLFCLIMTATPGPNTMMVLAAAARTRVAGASPLIAGIAVGSALQMATGGAGVGTTVAAKPALHVAISITCVGFFAWVATLIALGGPLRDELSATEISVAAAGLAGVSVVTLLIWAIGGAILRGILRNLTCAKLYNLSASMVLVVSILALLGGWA